VPRAWSYVAHDPSRGWYFLSGAWFKRLHSRWRRRNESPTQNGTPWDHSLVRKRKLHPLLNKLGIPRCGFHAFRHGNATLLDQIGAPLAVRLNRLGHIEAQTTMGYTHAVTADERRIADELGRILHGTARNEQEERPAENGLTLMIQ